MSRIWLREDQPEQATARILDAAERAFATLGVSAAGMSEIAELAGCSRGTLYRYFPNRHALHLAYVERAARRIGEHVRTETSHVRDPHERLVQGILLSLRAVRENPGTAAWFEAGSAGLAARMSRSHEVARVLRSGVSAAVAAGGGDSDGSRLAARWIVRVIVSFLTDPGEDEAEERALLERFVVPTYFEEIAKPDPDPERARY